MTYDEYCEILKELNAKKHTLENRLKLWPDQEDYRDWLKMAEEYEKIDARANAAECRRRAAQAGRLSIERVQEVPEPEVNPDPPEPEFDWQTRADIE